MNVIDIMDAFYPQDQRPFSAELSAGSIQGDKLTFVVRMNSAMLYVSRERLAELHARISEALAISAPEVNA